MYDPGHGNSDWKFWLEILIKKNKLDYHCWSISLLLVNL